MAPVFARPLQVTAALIGIALLGASLAPAQSSRLQIRHAPVPLPRAAPPPHVRLSQPPSTPNAQAPAAQGPALRQQSQPAPSPPVAVHVSPTQLNMVRTAPEQIGQVPSHFFWIRQGLQAVQDPVDGQLVFITDEGRVAGRAKLPAGFEIDEIFADENGIRLIDGGRRQVTIPRNIDPAAANTLSEMSLAAVGGTRGAQLTRRGPQHLQLNDARRTGARMLDVRSVAGGALAQAYEVGPGSGDNRYVVSEEIVASKPTLQVRVFAQRFDRDGRLSGVAYVSLEGMDAVPRNFIAVTGGGVVRVLVPVESGVKIRQIEFSSPTASQGKRRKVGENELKTLEKGGREVSVDTNVAPTGNFSRFRKADEVRFKVDVPTPPISRDDVIKNANAYLSVNWVMAPENFMRTGIENTCVPGEAKFWRRPTRFTPATVGQSIGPMPYRWGGDDTPQTFRLRLEWGALAGSICTCRDPMLDYCLSPESIGVDCSGLVSRAWGIEKRGTSGLLDVSTEVDNIANVRPGDAFDWPGRHVRLLVGNAPGAATAYTVIEASTRLECEGVCMRTYRPSELGGYKIIRYRGITD